MTLISLFSFLIYHEKCYHWNCFVCNDNNTILWRVFVEQCFHKNKIQVSRHDFLDEKLGINSPIVFSWRVYLADVKHNSKYNVIERTIDPVSLGQKTLTYMSNCVFKCFVFRKLALYFLKNHALSMLFTNSFCIHFLCFVCYYDAFESQWKSNNLPVMDKEQAVFFLTLK